MYLPSVERFQCDGKRPVRYSVIKQASHDAGSSIGMRCVKPNEYGAWS